MSGESNFVGMVIAARTLVTPGTSVRGEGNAPSLVHGSLELKLYARHWVRLQRGIVTKRTKTVPAYSGRQCNSGIVKYTNVLLVRTQGRFIESAISRFGKGELHIQH